MADQPILGPVLSVRDVHKSYGDTVALDGIDLDVAAGEIMCLLGPNGAGKTSLISIVAGLRRADAGTVTVAGIDVARNPVDARRKLGLAPQELGVYAEQTVDENLRYFGELVGLRGVALRQEIADVADSFELTALVDRRARTLSGGEKRRLHAAMALLGRPPLLLLDEPTSGVDVATRAKILDTVRRLADHGCAICYSTHYLGEVEQLDASVTIIDRGRVIAEGSVGELIKQHGATALELTFDVETDEALPRIEGYRVEQDGALLRVYSEQPARDAPAVLVALGSDAARLESLTIVSPSLEAVFLALTGRRFDEEHEEDSTDVDVA